MSVRMMPLPMLNGRANGCRQKRNGSMKPVEDWQVRAIRGEIQWIVTKPITMGVWRNPAPLGSMRLKATGCMVWRGMYMNDGRIGMTKTTTATYQLRTHQDRALTHPGCCEVGLGITRLMTCAWLPASTAVQLISTATTGFDVRQDRIKK